MPDQTEWLDRIIAEQAEYYGMTVDQFVKAMENAAKLQEQAEIENWE